MSFVNPYRFGSGGGIVGAHRYWRINITAIGGSSSSSIVELEMYESRFGPNVCSGVTAASSGNFDAQYDASEAFDTSLIDNGGGTSALWASNAAVSWLRADFGSGNAKAVVGIGVHGRQASFVAQMPTDFDVQYSDDASSWTTAWSEAGVTWSANEFKRFYHPSLPAASHSGSPHGSHSYWRVVVPIAQDSSVGVSIAELEMRATPSGADQCTGGTAAASSEFSGSFTAAMGFDNDASSFWRSTDAGRWGPWLRYQFASPVSVAQLTVATRNSGSVTTSPKALVFQYADSSSGPWTTILASHNLATWSLGEVRTYTDPNYV